MCRSLPPRGERLEYWERCGALWPARLGRVKLAILGFEHNRDHVDDLVAGVRRFEEVGSIRYLRHWLRGLLPYLPVITAHKDGPGVIAQLWKVIRNSGATPAVDVLDDFAEGERKTVLRAISKTANRSVIQSLGSVPATILRPLAGPWSTSMHLASLSGRSATSVCTAVLEGREVPSTVRARRLSWDFSIAPPIRPLARPSHGLAMAGFGSAAASNSLNQTVFQLRRSWRRNPRATTALLVATSESTRFQPHLVVTDLAEFRRLADAARMRALQPPGLPQLLDGRPNTR